MPGKDFGKKSFGGGRTGNLKNKPVDMKKKPFQKNSNDAKPRSAMKVENKTENARKSSDDSEKKRKRDSNEGENAPAQSENFTYDGKHAKSFVDQQIQKTEIEDT